MAAFILSRTLDTSHAAIHSMFDAATPLSLSRASMSGESPTVDRPRPTGRGTIARSTAAGDGERRLGRNVGRDEVR